MIRKCRKCNKKFVTHRLRQIFCSRKCKNSNFSKFIECLICSKKCWKTKKGKFCSQSCAAKNRIPELIKRNKIRRKYPAIEGLSRGQVFYRMNIKSRKYNLKKDIKKRELLIKFLGGRCAKCNYKKDIRALELDHKYSDGNKDRKRIGCKIQRYYILHLDEAKKRLQVLCSNCNKIKSIVNKEHNKSRRLYL